MARVKLLHQHRPRQHMRPGGRAEGEQQVCSGTLGITMPVRRAEHEARFTHAFVTPAPQEGGKNSLTSWPCHVHRAERCGKGV